MTTRFEVAGGSEPAPPARETERTMLDRLNTRYGGTYRNGSYEGVRHVRAEHVPTSAGFSYGHTRIADYIAIDMFVPKSPTDREKGERTMLDRNGSIHGHEVKVSRSDWLAELRDPTKAEAWARHCHHWWLVAPREVVRDDLPAGWGLLVPWRGSLRVAVQATRRDPEPMPVTMLAALARAVAKTEVRLANTPTPPNQEQL